MEDTKNEVKKTTKKKTNASKNTTKKSTTNKSTRKRSNTKKNTTTSLSYNICCFIIRMGVANNQQSSWVSNSNYNTCNNCRKKLFDKRLRYFFDCEIFNKYNFIHNLIPIIFLFQKYKR